MQTLYQTSNPGNQMNLEKKLGNNSVVSIKLNDLRKSFNNKLVIKGISFSAQQGEIVGFLGPNGAGKTTTMRMITGFLTPSAGTVNINGVDLTEDPVQVKRNLGYLPEGAPSYHDSTVCDYLKFIAKLRGYTGSQLNNCLDRVVEQVNLRSVWYQQIEQLSKGFKRRVGLAQAILHDPPILILDEPTDGLDPNQKYEVRLLIKNMAKNKVIILSTHILEEVEALCNRVVVISDGLIIADGSPNQFSAHKNKRTIKLTVQDPNNREIIDLSDLQQQFSQVIFKKNLELLELETAGELEEFFRQATNSNN